MKRAQEITCICQTSPLRRGDRKVKPFWKYALTCIKREIRILSQRHEASHMRAPQVDIDSRPAQTPRNPDNVNNTIKIIQSHSIWMSPTQGWSPDGVLRPVPWYKSDSIAIVYEFLRGQCNWWNNFEAGAVSILTKQILD